MIALLFRHLVESTLFCLLLGGLACCLQRQAAAARYTVWLIGISKFCIPTLLLAATGARMAFLLPATSGISLLANKLSALLVAVFGLLPSRIDASDATVVSLALLTIWATGMVAMFVAWSIRLRRSYCDLAVTSIEELETLDQAKRLLGLRMFVRLRSADKAREPSLLGILHPTVIIPKGLFEELTPSEFEAVLVHELAHAARRDNLTGAFVHCLVCVFWFYPLLWMVEKRLLKERERACDEMVIGCGTAPQIYATGIVKVCRFHLFDYLAGVSAMTRSDLKIRLDLILSCRLYRPVPDVVRLLLAGLGIVMTILPIAGGYCQQCISNGQTCTPISSLNSDQRRSNSISGATGRRRNFRDSCPE